MPGRDQRHCHRFGGLDAVHACRQDAAGIARAFAGRIMREAGRGTEDRIRRAYRIVLAREPKPDEVEQARAFIDSQAAWLRKQDVKGLSLPADLPADVEPAEAAAWADFAQAMLNRNEFIYVP